MNFFRFGAPVWIWYWNAIFSAASTAEEPLSLKWNFVNPFGMMEAMRTGLPPVASAVAGQTDLVDQRRNGLLYPAGDEAAYLEAVRALLEEDRRRRLGGWASRSVRRYSIRRVFATNIAAAGYLRPVKRRKKQ